MLNPGKPAGEMLAEFGSICNTAYRTADSPGIVTVELQNPGPDDTGNEINLTLWADNAETYRTANYCRKIDFNSIP